MKDENDIPAELLMPGEMRPEEQVDEWVKGNSIHNNNRWYSVVDDSGKITERLKMKDGECCPDFSCCSPHLLWDEQTRKLFKNADHGIRMKMMGGAVQALIADEKLKAHVNDGSHGTLQ